MPACIRIIGASQHNLKHINLDLPLNTLTVITGVSGAGKSSLAYDVLYAEGQRRYIETFSPYARQFIERMDRPAVEKIEGILPAIAIDQRQPVKTSRSTVGTMTEITDFVKLLFAHLATLHCPQCGREVTQDTPSKVANILLTAAAGKRVIICFPCVLNKDKKRELERLGFDRIWEDEEIKNIEEVKDTKQAYVMVDRLRVDTRNKARLIEDIEMAMSFGQGEVAICVLPKEMLKFSRDYACPYCGIKYRLPVPNFFSFNSPLGACERCKGFGRIIDYDIDLVIPDRNKSLADGAIKIWKKGSYEYQDLISFCHAQGIPTDIPFSQLPLQAQKEIIQGGHGFYGIKGFFRWLETKIYKMHVRVFLSRYRGYFTCPDCGGTRFKKEVLFYRLKGKNIAQIYALTIDEAYAFFSQSFSGEKDPAVKLLLNEINHRLYYLKEVGVGYLTLDRQSRSLSGGEVARVNLTRASGSSLVNMLFVLDEPTVGLHPRDNQRLIKILKDLSKENTVVVVEHDPDIIQAADYILDMGPGAGENGGNIVYFGELKGFLKNKDSITAKYLRGEKHISLCLKRPRPRKWLQIKGAAAHNLKNIDVSIPLGMMVCLTGVSGAGKSTLAYEIIYKGIKKEKGDFKGVPGKYNKILGLEYIDDVILVDQTPIGRTPRANPATYLGIFSEIRHFFASLPESKLRGYTPGTFSFNSPGGRCKVCQGVGFERIEMQFLSDVYLTCPACKGNRYQPEILEITYQGKNIADVLNMTFKQCFNFFAEYPKIKEQFLPLMEIGLDYLRLGQPINTLSAGEAQRLKLAKYLKMNKKRYLFIFDEPTVGLHLADIEYLLKSLQNLLHKGHSLIVIEHHLEVIRAADYVIDLGPEGGPGGGRLVASGTPEEIEKIKESYTGQCLAKSSRFIG